MASSEVRRTLESAGVRFARVTFCDAGNVIRSKAIHVGVLDNYMEHGVGITAGQMALPVMYDAVVAETGLGPVGEVRLVPDWDTLAPLSYSPGHVRVMGDMILRGKPWAYCPRDFLKRMQAAAAALGLEICAAFENEFFLLEASQPVLKDDTVFAATLALDLHCAYINDVADALLGQDIAVELCHSEAGPGQIELSVRYDEALAAADHQIAVRETVRGVALRHHMRATFLPKVVEDKAGSGCHIHFSLWREGRNVTGQGTGLTDEASSFVAGILEHLPALMAVTTPSTNSYRRLRPHYWSGAYRCWGYDNREGAVRVPTDDEGRVSNIELKTSDASANPHLALGAMIACGLDGVRRGLKLGDAVQCDPGGLAEDERPERLPSDLGQAIAHLRQDRLIEEAMGAPLFQAFVAVREAEWQALKDYSLAEEIALLVDRY